MAYTETEVVVVIDGEIVNYQKVGHNTWGWEIVWGCDAYIGYLLIHHILVLDSTILCYFLTYKTT